MPLYPQFEPQYTQQIMTDTFGGYDHQLKIPDGEWYDTWNVTTDYAPMLANRKLRGKTGEEACAMIEKKSLAYVGSDGTLYFNWLPTELTGLSVGEKQMVSMGAYIVIFPDKVYINTEDLSDYGSMEANFQPTSTTYEMVRYDGSAVDADYVQPTAPDNPQNGDYWIDTSGEVHILKQWADYQNDWVSVETVYIKATFNTMGQVPALFKELDGVSISGSSVDVNGDKAIYALGGRAEDVETQDPGEADWIMVTGLLDFIPDDPDTDVVIRRTVPDLDYVCEAQNRLWGCYYGIVNGKTVNEIYCCALGDFKNWRQYQGLSTDSWTGSVGSDGQWTGAVNYLGYPTFFKENRIHRVTISTEGAHRIDETVCRGVQKGSSKSLVVVNETLYYKSRSDVCAYQGGFPQDVSQALGNVEYHRAVAGSVNGKYYISMLDSNDVPHLFVFDIVKGIWLHEDDLEVNGFARVDNELYAHCPSILGTAGGEIITMNGSLPDVDNAAQESNLTWGVISGVQYYEYPENKRVTRYNIRMRMEQGATVKVYVRYDGDIVSDITDPDWFLAGQITATETGIKHYILPVRTRRCDHMQLAIRGAGNAQIYSIAKILEVGSDYR
ncbi:MAG: hypothetical protein IKD61_03375 [Oscillospiraceae bacterium]|nr:hypothetical protein [Oscillospiraceae bacterium]